VSSALTLLSYYLISNYELWITSLALFFIIYVYNVRHQYHDFPFKTKIIIMIKAIMVMMVMSEVHGHDNDGVGA
jgi:O-antigen/teichoic acid export membrane protein